MSGWIKIEKDLETDPRVLRMAKELAKLLWMFDRDDDPDDRSNALALPAVTLVCGALTRIWIYADSHARDDDSLDLGPDELDEWVGIPGFCSLMPDDWLRVIDAGRVELPGYQSHNGTEAKKRALTQKRVALHRSNAKRDDVTACNASSLPDQDQTKTKTRPEEKTTTAASRPHDDPSEFLDFKLAYPDRAGDQGWRKAVKAANARIAEGHTWVEMIAGAARYAAFVRASGNEGSEFVKQAATFLGPDKHFLQPWDPPPNKADRRLAANVDVMQQFVNEGRA